ncbi:MAG: serine/threonine protein kinase [Acidobacteriia bacterium]|nr:serine/threonine protein kinase [Terriglobia bacterium]
MSHVVYGLKIAANIPLPGLPIQPIESQQEVDVRIKLKEHPDYLSTLFDSSNDFFYSSPNCDGNGVPNLRVAILGGGGYYGFYYSDGVRFAISRDGREIQGDWPENYALEDACTYLIGPVIAFALRLRGITCLHASAIAVGGQAIALLGRPGAGKSTTAAAFARLGYSILSDDIAVLDDRGDRILVQPGYPRVNLWPDSVRALFGSEEELAHITPTWEKRFLALDQNGYRFQSVALPLSAVYLLDEREAALAAPLVEELTASDALVTLVANTYLNYLLNAEMRRREFEALGRLKTGIHVRRVRPTGDPSKVFELCKTIYADAMDLWMQSPRMQSRIHSELGNCQRS